MTADLTAPAQQHPLSTAVGPLRTALDKLDGWVWEIVTVILALTFVGYGLSYAIGGNPVAGPSLGVIKQLVSVRAHGVVTLAFGVALLWSLRSKWPPLVLALQTGWCMFTGVAAAIAFYRTGLSPGAIVIWMVCLGPLSTAMLLLCPDRRLLYGLVLRLEMRRIRRASERRAGVA